MLLISAFRYALGRRTYIVGQTIAYLKEDWDIFSAWQQKQIQGDIKQAIEVKCAGDEWDADNWKRVLEFKVKEEE